MQASAAAYALIIVAMMTGPSWAQSVGEIEDKGAKQVSKQELNELLPGSTHTSKTDIMGERRLKHEADGRMDAHAMGTSFTNNRGQSGTGKWWVSDEGRYCFTIDWPRNTEKRCMVVYKLEDYYYGTGRPGDRNAGTLKFTLTK